jgi:hypothetical protein
MYTSNIWVCVSLAQTGGVRNDARDLRKFYEDFGRRINSNPGNEKLQSLKIDFRHKILLRYRLINPESGIRNSKLESSHFQKSEMEKVREL